MRESHNGRHVSGDWVKVPLPSKIRTNYNNKANQHIFTDQNNPNCAQLLSGPLRAFSKVALATSPSSSMACLLPRGLEKVQILLQFMATSF